MSFQISIAQFIPTLGCREKNLEKHLYYIDQAIKAGSDLIVFPELSLTGYTLMDLVPSVALNPDSRLLEPLYMNSGLISICFGLVEESPDYFYYNSSFFLEDGRLIKSTRKVYPPTYGAFQEKRFFAQGKSVQAFDSKLGRFGVLICNDARHPALAYIYALDGAKIIITQSAVPARGFPKGDKPDPVKYFENGHSFYSSVFGLYTVFANLAGCEDSLLFCGNSMVVAPGGKVIAEAPLFEEAMITAQISDDEIRRCRTVTPLLAEEDIDITVQELKRIRKEGKF